MDKKKAIIGVIAVLFIGIGAAWAMGYFHRTDPAFAELQQLRDQMRTAPDADRQGLRDQFRQKMEGLTDDQRREFFQSNRGQFRQDMRRQMNEFFAMSPADQKKRLDEMIDRNIKRQKERAAQGGGQGGPGGGGGGAIGGAAGGGGRGGGGNRTAQTDGQREQRQKSRLDNSDPVERGQQDKFRQMMGDRMQQRGIQPGQGGGGPWMGGRG